MLRPRAALAARAYPAWRKSRPGGCTLWSAQVPARSTRGATTATARWATTGRRSGRRRCWSRASVLSNNGKLRSRFCATPRHRVSHSTGHNDAYLGGQTRDASSRSANRSSMSRTLMQMSPPPGQLSVRRSGTDPPERRWRLRGEGGLGSTGRMLRMDQLHVIRHGAGGGRSQPRVGRRWAHLSSLATLQRPPQGDNARARYPAPATWPSPRPSPAIVFSSRSQRESDS